MADDHNPSSQAVPFLDNMLSIIENEIEATSRKLTEKISQVGTILDSKPQLVFTRYLYFQYRFTS